MSAQDTPEKKPDASSAPDSEAIEAAPAARSRQADPQSIVALAVQMLQPKFQKYPDRFPSDTIFDDDFIEAIRRARWALDAASGRSNDTFHAYQLFEEDAEPMSFQAIADRFIEVKRHRKDKALPTSKSTIEKDIKVMIQAAAEQIEREENRLGVALSNHVGYPIDFDQVHLRMRRLAFTMIEESPLAQFVQDHDEVARQLADQFTKVLLRKNQDLDKPWHDDHAEQLIGLSGFIQYVCNGLTHSEFMGIDHPEPNFVDGDDDRDVPETLKPAVPAMASTEARWVRPYEVFLYASQAGILPEKYVAKLSDLKDGFLPQPKRRSSFSILWAHKGGPPVADATPEAP